MRRLCAGLIVILLWLLSYNQVWALEVSGSAPGNGGDNLQNTFHFNFDNRNLQLTKPDGTPLSYDDMSLAYGSSFQIFNDNLDWILFKKMRVMGADLSGFTWTSVNFPTPGTLAIDPTSGRFKFAAPVWERMGYIDMPPGDVDGVNIPIVMHLDGSAMVAFAQPYNGQKRVFANRYIADQGWQGPVLVDAVSDTVPAMEAKEPALAMDSEGRVMCVFRQNTFTSNYRVYANLYLPGIGWQGPMLIDSGQDRPAESPAAAMISGKAICVFSQEDSGGVKRVYANEYTPANGWYGAVTIDAGNADDNSSPQVVMNSSGRAFCFYTREALTPRIHAVEYVPGAGWQGFTPIDQGTATNIGANGLAMNNSGRALCMLGMIVSGPQYQLQAVEYVPGQGWQTPVDLFTTSTPFTGGSLVLNQAGIGLAACEVTDGTSIRLYVRQYSAGAGWYAPVLADTGMVTYVNNSRLVLNDQGQGICVFRQNDGSQDRIYVNHFAVGSGWSGAQALDAHLGFGARDPMVAMNQAGAALCTWRQYDGAKYRVDTARYQVEYPQGTVSVRYYYTPAAAALPAANALTIGNRKLEPLKGGKTNIRLALAQAGMASVKVYSLQGQLVKTLADQYLAAGNYDYAWAAVNDGGNLVASGVYLIRVKSPGIDKTQKVVVIK